MNLGKVGFERPRAQCVPEVLMLVSVKCVQRLVDSTKNGKNCAGGSQSGSTTATCGQSYRSTGSLGSRANNTMAISTSH